MYITMRDMLNKTSLKFTIGFIAILFIGFAGVYIMGYFAQESGAINATTALQP